ncbi:hypothetical protein F5884DRAFT_853710 [Xylogone sp. PMI_703]|nr:hypothetical protein F5884DRAFT_853710 [Xylogone sp. PMI_703]
MTEHITSISESSHLRTPPQFPWVPQRSGNHPYHSPRTQPQYQTAGARSTRMIIESASYETTPTESPPDEYHCVFSAQDCHHSVPSVETLAAIEQSLSAENGYKGMRHSPLIHATETPSVTVENFDNGTVGAKNEELEVTQGHPTKVNTGTEKLKGPVTGPDPLISDTGEESDDEIEIDTSSDGKIRQSRLVDLLDSKKLKQHRRGKKKSTTIQADRVKTPDNDMSENLNL